MRVLLLSSLIWVALIMAPVFAQSQPPEELFVPILINGVVGESSHYQTVFRFVELSGTTADPAVTVDMDTFDNAGSEIDPGQLFCHEGPPRPPVPFSLPGSGSFHFGTAGRVIGYQPPSIIDGWARLTITGSGRIQITAEVFQVAGVPAGCQWLVSGPSDFYRSDVVVQAVKPAKVWRAPAVITAYRHTALSVVNFSPTNTAHVFIELLDEEGTGRRGRDFPIPPMHRRSAFAWEWVDPNHGISIGVPVPVPDDFYGSARIVSDVPVAVGAVQVLSPEGKLVSAPVTPDP